MAQRQTCLAPLIRTARGLAERQSPNLASCGAWALAELQCLCHMATAPPTGGEWRAWYARLCRLIDQYYDRPDEMRQARLALGHSGLVDPIAITDEQPSPILDEGGKDGGGGRWKMDNVAGKK